MIGNPAHDLIRLGLSLAMAARGSDLPGVTTARMVERMIEGYETAFAPEAQGETRGRDRCDAENCQTGHARGRRSLVETSCG